MIKNIIKITTACIMIAGLLLLSSGPVAASFPVPLAGQFSLTYNNGTKFMAGCKFGDSYRNLCGLPGAACTPSQEGDLEYSTAGSVLRYCNGSNWINVQCEALGSCVGIAAGTISADALQMKYCNGVTWQAMYNDGICTGIGVQEALFTPSGAAGGVEATFYAWGRSIDMTDDYAIVGAHRATTNRIVDGAATIYKRSGGSWTRLKELSPTVHSANGAFGRAVGLSGNYAIVGHEGISRISIFKRDQGGADNWGQIATHTGDSNFGVSVDIFGDKAIAGSHNYTAGGTVGIGRARIYRRDRGGADAWGLAAILNFPDVNPVHYDYFGWVVTIAGDVAAVAAAHRDEPGAVNTGAVYLYRETSQDTWTYFKKLTNPNGMDANDYFGHSMDIIDLDGDGTADRLAISAPYDDEQFGDRGTVFIFERNQGGANNWGLVAKAADATVSPTSRHIGLEQLGLGGDYMVVGSRLNDALGTDSGAVLVFRKDEGGANNWGLQTYLWGSDTNTLDEIGRAATVSSTGNYLMAGAPFQENDGVKVGAAYVFGRSGATWSQQAKLTPPGTYGYSRRMGDSVAVSGDYAAVSIIFKSGFWLTNRLAREGGVNIYRRQPNSTWVLEKHVTPPSPQGDLYFGQKIDISPEYMVVSVPLDSTGGVTRGGGAWIFGRNIGGVGNWGQIKLIKPIGVQAEDRAGETNGLSLFGDYIALGAWRHDRDLIPPLQGDAGAVYLFHRNEGGADNWGQRKKIESSVTEHSARFGQSVDIAGTVLVAGAPYEDANGVDAGAVYIFERDFGGAENWGQTKRLVGQAASDLYGWDVAVSGDTVVVGSPHHDEGGTDKGAIYIYYRNHGGPGNWGLFKKIPYPGAGVGNALFGRSVDLSGDILIVGAPADDVNATDAGYVYVYSRNEGGADNWGVLATIVPNTPSEGDYFGEDVAVSGNVVAGSGLYNDDSGTDDGSVYLFGCPPL